MTFIVVMRVGKSVPSRVLACAHASYMRACVCALVYMCVCGPSIV